MKKGIVFALCLCVAVLLFGCAPSSSTTTQSSSLNSSNTLGKMTYKYSSSWEKAEQGPNIYRYYLKVDGAADKAWIYYRVVPNAASTFGDDIKKDLTGVGWTFTGSNPYTVGSYTGVILDCTNTNGSTGQIMQVFDGTNGYAVMISSSQKDFPAYTGTYSEVLKSLTIK